MFRADENLLVHWTNFRNKRGVDENIIKHNLSTEETVARAVFQWEQ
jgi:hypothetical protein